MEPSDPAQSEPIRASAGLPELGAEIGEYTLRAVLGSGGMGTIYRAQHRRLGREVALKMLLPQLASREDVRKRFFGEARAVNRIRHENLVEVTDFFDQDVECCYYIMELLEGLSLRDLITSSPNPPPLERSLGIWLQLTDVLAALHEDCIVHRDLKPENIFLVTRSSSKDFVKLLDFGVARILDAEGELILPRESGDIVVGTPHYMAPEQAAAKEVDDLADIYSLGAIMYEMVTGLLPHDAHDIKDLLLLKKTTKPRDPTSYEDLPFVVPAPLNDLIMECLDRDPACRPQSMQEVRLRLKMMDLPRAPEDQAPPPPTPLQLDLPRAGRRRRRLRQVRMALMAAGLLGGIVTVIALLASSTGSHPSRSAATSGPQAPATIELRFSSNPTGASVLRADTGVVLGITPFVWASAHSAPAELAFRLDGYETVVRLVDLSKDGDVHADLTKKRENAQAKQGKKNKRAGLRRGGFMDPFAEKR